MIKQFVADIVQTAKEIDYLIDLEPSPFSTQSDTAGDQQFQADAMELSEQASQAVQVISASMQDLSMCITRGVLRLTVKAKSVDS